jgi:hypothetical protein
MKYSTRRSGTNPRGRPFEIDNGFGRESAPREEMVLDRDMLVMRLYLERLLPPRRERLIRFDVGPVQTAQQAADTMDAVWRAIGERQMMPGEGASDQHDRRQESVPYTADLDRRVEELGKRSVKRGSCPPQEKRT